MTTGLSLVQSGRGSSHYKVISSKPCEYLREGYSRQKEWGVPRCCSQIMCEMFEDNVYVE